MLSLSEARERFEEEVVGAVSHGAAFPDEEVLLVLSSWQDIMPGSICTALELREGSTFAQGVKEVRRRLRE